jgi:DNA primase
MKEHNTDTIDGKVGFLNKVADILSRIDNNVEREMYIKKMAEGYDISEEALFAEVLRKIRPNEVPERKVANLTTQGVKIRQAGGDETENRLIHDERFILSLLCVDNSMYIFVKERVNEEFFKGEENKKLFAAVKERLETNKGITPAEFTGMVSSESAGDFARIINEECFCDDNKKAIMGKIRDIRLNRAESRQKLVLELLKKQSDLPEGDVEKLKEELKTLSLKIREYKSM